MVAQLQFLGSIELPVCVERQQIVQSWRGAHARDHENVAIPSRDMQLKLPFYCRSVACYVTVVLARADSGLCGIEHEIVSRAGGVQNDVVVLNRRMQARLIGNIQLQRVNLSASTCCHSVEVIKVPCSDTNLTDRVRDHQMTNGPGRRTARSSKDQNALLPLHA
jgi:hypothetical protein